MACNGRQFNSIEEDVCQLVYVERAEVFKSEDVSFLPFFFSFCCYFTSGLIGLSGSEQGRPVCGAGGYLTAATPILPLIVAVLP